VLFSLLDREICHLNNPRGIATYGTDEFLVAEAGCGGNFDNPQFCAVVEGALNCLGKSGAMVVKSCTKTSRFFGDIWSAAQAAMCSPNDPGYVAAGREAIGFDGVSLREDRAYGVVAFGGVPDTAAGHLLEFSGFQLLPNSVGDLPTTMPKRIREAFAKKRPPAYRATADLAAYEAANNPDGAQIDSDPFGVVALPNGETWVADAAANAVIRDNRGVLSTAAVFGPQPSPSPLDSCAPTYEFVPTGLAYNEKDGDVYVGQLTGFPFPPHVASVYRIHRTKGAAADGSQDTFTTSQYTTGFTNIIGITFDELGNLYVLEHSHYGLGPNGPCFGPPPPPDCTQPANDPTNLNFCALAQSELGALWMVKPTGEKQLLIGVPNCGPTGLILSEPLVRPGGIAYANGKLYITNRSVYCGIGEVVSLNVRKYQYPPACNC